MRVCLDACVLYPTILRELLFDIASGGGFAPLWSERILEEWARAVAANHPEQSQLVRAEIALAESRFQSALIAGGQSEGEFDLPDPNDVHVLQTAIAGGAEALVTFNLRDFPSAIATRFGIRVLHPDLFLLEMLARHQSQVQASVRRIHAQALAAGGEGLNHRRLFKKARLPRFAKAIEAELMQK